MAGVLAAHPAIIIRPHRLAQRRQLKPHHTAPDQIVAVGWRALLPGRNVGHTLTAGPAAPLPPANVRTLSGVARRGSARIELDARSPGHFR
jgi:hypothetical protein